MLGSSFHLTADHIMVDPPRLHEFLVFAALDNAAILHEQDHIGAANR